MAALRGRGASMTDPVIKLFVQGYEEEIARLREQLAEAQGVIARDGPEMDAYRERAEAAEAQLAKMRAALEGMTEHCCCYLDQHDYCIGRIARAALASPGDNREETHG